jgi:hypothetical protein
MQKVTVTNEIDKGEVAVISKETAKEAPVTNIFKSGLKAVTMPTPVIATNIFRFVLYAAYITSEVVTMFPEIPHTTAEKIVHYCLRAIALTHFISKTFGIDISKILPPSQTTSKN